MSELRVDSIKDSAGSGSPTFTNGIKADTITDSAGTGSPTFPNPITFPEQVTFTQPFIGATQYLNVIDQKSNGTSGGAVTASTWSSTRRRDINTIRTNTIAGASLGTNEIILPSGVYHTFITSPFYRITSNRIRLVNVSNADEVLLESQSNFSSSGGDVQTNAEIRGRFTLNATSTLQVWWRTSSSQGVANDMGVSASLGNFEIYTQVEIWKVA
jgi:hypothetical protein